MQHAIYWGQKSGIRIVLSSKGEQKSGVKPGSQLVARPALRPCDQSI